jgi:hypothetical protein
MALALVRRRLHDGGLTPEAAIEMARQIHLATPLDEREQQRIGYLDDYVSLATNGYQGTTEDARSQIVKFLEEYAAFDNELPM